jgi:hypothetical protein
VFAFIAGFDYKEIGAMALAGIKQVAPTGILLMFAVLYFSVMLDAGLFDPVIAFIVRSVKGDPLKVIAGHGFAYDACAFGWRWHCNIYDRAVNFFTDLQKTRHEQVDTCRHCCIECWSNAPWCRGRELL